MNKPTKTVTPNAKTLRNRRKRLRQKERLREIKQGVPVDIVKKRVSGYLTKDYRYTGPRKVIEPPGMVKDPEGKKEETEIVETPNLKSSDVDFINMHLDPCGEYSTSVMNARVPDGSVQQSVGLEYREVAIVKCPASNPNDLTPDLGKMWNLTLFHWPMYKLPLIMVASTANAEPTREQIRACYSALNSLTTLSNATYPTWASTTPTIFYSVLPWTATTGLDLKNTENQWFKQFRIVADGMTVFHNAPDLVNQGMAVGAQYSTDFKLVSDDNVDNTAIEFTVNISEQAGTGSAAQRGFDITFPSVFTVSPITGTIAATDTGTPQTFSFGFQTNQVLIWGETGVTTTAGVTISCVIALNSYDGVTGASSYTVGLSYGTTTLASGVIELVGSTATGQYKTVVTSSSASPIDRVVATIPSSSTENLVQETAKTVTMTMKEDNGVYMVKRVWEPVFNWTLTSKANPVKFDTGDASVESTTSALIDVFDTNYGVGVINFSGIPYACAPMIKLYRAVELVAGRDSPYGPVMTKCPARNPIVQDVIRDFAVDSPFMYGESFNCLGLLFNIITNTLSKLPKFIAVAAPVIGDIVQAASNAVGVLSNQSRNVNRLVKKPDVDENGVVRRLIGRFLPAQLY